MSSPPPSIRIAPSGIPRHLHPNQSHLVCCLQRRCLGLDQTCRSRTPRGGAQNLHLNERPRCSQPRPKPSVKETGPRSTGREDLEFSASSPVRTAVSSSFFGANYEYRKDDVVRNIYHSWKLLLLLFVFSAQLKTEVEFCL